MPYPQIFEYATNRSAMIALWNREMTVNQPISAERRATSADRTRTASLDRIGITGQQSEARWMVRTRLSQRRLNSLSLAVVCDALNSSTITSSWDRLVGLKLCARQLERSRWQHWLNIRQSRKIVAKAQQYLRRIQTRATEVLRINGIQRIAVYSRGEWCSINEQFRNFENNCLAANIANW